MSPDLFIFNFIEASNTYKIINIISILFVVFLTIKFFNFIKKYISLIQIALIISLLSIGSYNIINTAIKFNSINNKQIITNTSSKNFEKVYTFNKNNKNIFLIVLDMFSSHYLPYIFKEKPELLESFKGFVYYPNTTSFGYHTGRGLPPIFGGYQYTPINIDNRTDEPFLSKFYESFNILPLILDKNNFNVTISDLHLVREDYFTQRKVLSNNIKYYYTAGKYTKLLIDEKNLTVEQYDKTLYNNLIRFSFLKVLPIALNKFLYDDGNYLSINKFNHSTETIDNYTSLYYLTELTEIIEDTNNYSTILYNPLPHHPAFMQFPDYEPSNNITFKGNSEYSRDKYYHACMASMLLLQRYFDFLIKNNVYNNTRIIIVSDHGNWLKLWNNNTSLNLPDYLNLNAYNSLLMVKDYNVNFDYKTSNEFMTIADVPHISTEGIIQNLINPFTGKELFIEKDNGAVLCAYDWEKWVKAHTGNVYSDKYLNVHTDIFKPENWSVYNDR